MSRQKIANIAPMKRRERFVEIVALNNEGQIAADL
jgi:hypothetical protein